LGRGRSKGRCYAAFVSRVVAFVDDLLFLSRIRAAAGAGVEVLSVRSVEALVAECRSAPVALVLVDLDSPRLSGIAALEALTAEPAGKPVSVGFFSHVSPERARQALAAGCDRVLPRSLFVIELKALLAGSAG
jgi:CheY-like chemotaxis protein